MLISRYTHLGVLFGLLCMASTSASAVECSEIHFRDTRSTACTVEIRRDRLRLFLYDESGKPFTSFRRLTQSLAAHNEQLAFAMNAGMYREDYSPVGLLVMDGHQVHRLNLASGFGNFYLKPNGVFVLSPSGASIVESSEYRSLPEPAVWATQSGPLLLHGGEINRTFNPQGTSRLIRNGVGIMKTDEVVFVISEDPIGFYDFALLFREQFKCTEALYLDGNVSSLYSRDLGRDDEHVLLGPIIGVTQRRKSEP
jgi:uncharacterized protein YigE (DUF2233 family)